MDRLKSQSMSRTLLSDPAIAMARFEATVVLPSPGAMLVTRIVLGGESEDSMMDVLRDLKLSARALDGSSKTIL